jgi:hypothetical protein
MKCYDLPGKIPVPLSLLGLFILVLFGEDEFGK